MGKWLPWQTVYPPKSNRPSQRQCAITFWQGKMKGFQKMKTSVLFAAGSRDC